MKKVYVFFLSFAIVVLASAQNKPSKIPVKLKNISCSVPLNLSSDMPGNSGKDNQYSWYPYTDGLLYWNENMAPLDSALLNNDSLLYSSGNYITGMLDYTGNDTIDFPFVGVNQFPFGNYYLSLTSMPQIIMDNNDIYVTYSSLREDKTNPGANPYEQLYRHLYAVRSGNLGNLWGTPVDLTGDVIHDYDECIFGSLSYSSDSKLHIVYMADNEPGLADRGDLDPYNDNYIYYLNVPKSDIPTSKKSGIPKAVNEWQIGATRFDLQTNSSVQNRVYLFPDNTIGASFTFGIVESSFPERGTGYNYFDGSTWGAIPSVRIENTRSGWPSYMPLPGGGELVISHKGTSGLLVSSRATKGTGTWTTSTLVGPTVSGGSTALLFPRAIASGNTIHLIACTDNGTYPSLTYYQGLASALVYYKSTDGGQTWSAPAILPGMDSASVVHLPNFSGFNGDSYAWAAPRGDTIAFTVGDSWLGLFIMKSFDAGSTWTKIHIYDFPDLPTAPTPVVATVDGSVACAIDTSGKVHVVFGKKRVSDSYYFGSINENNTASDLFIYPNPANEYFHVDFNLSRSENVRVCIDNIMGQQVFEKDFGTLNSGKQTLHINAVNFNSGIYFMTVGAGENKVTRKIVVE
jgi:hypothetical protein